MTNIASRNVGVVPPKAVLFLLAAQTCLLLYSATLHSISPDELAHLPAGLSHVSRGDFSSYTVNPPLFRIVATAPLFVFPEIRDASTSNAIFGQSNGPRDEYRIGRKFVAQFGKKSLFYYQTARQVSVVFALIGGYVCWRWASELYGAMAGIFATFLWAFSPYVLGFGAVLTPDVASAAMGSLAIYLFWSWLRHGDSSGMIVAGTALGLANATKSTWLVVCPILVILAITQCPSVRPCRLNCKYLLIQLALISFVAWIVLLSVYGFKDCFRPIGELRFQSVFLSGSENSILGSGNWLRDSWLHNFPCPLPLDYVLGIDMQKSDMEPGKNLAYLRGELRENGWFYYYAYALLIKSSIGGIGLFVATVVLRVVAHKRVRSSELFLIIPALVIFVVASSQIGLNKHVRYLLPTLPLVIVWLSQSITIVRGKLGQSFVMFLGTLGAVSSLAAFPHNMSYFNELVGGGRNGHRHLLNSNVDWGQDLVFLSHKVRELNWKEFGLVSWTSYDARVHDIDFFLPPVLTQENREMKLPADLTAGNYAVGVSQLYGYPHISPDGRGGYGGNVKDGFSYFRQFRPIGRVADSMFLYSISEEDISEIRNTDKQ